MKTSDMERNNQQISRLGDGTCYALDAVRLILRRKSLVERKIPRSMIAKERNTVLYLGVYSMLIYGFEPKSTMTLLCVVQTSHAIHMTWSLPLLAPT